MLPYRYLSRRLHPVGRQLQTYQLEAGDLLLGLPNTIISHAMVSPKHKIRLAAFSTQFLQRVVKMEKDTWNTVMHIHNSPIKSVGEEGDKEIFKFYRELLMAKITTSLITITGK